MMKSFLIICFLVLLTAFLQTQGYLTEDAVDWYKAKTNLDDDLGWGEDEPEEMMVDALAREQEDDYSNCSCKDECTQLHVSRLPLVVRVSIQGQDGP